jgi:hypothetical protein
MTVSAIAASDVTTITSVTRRRRCRIAVSLPRGAREGKKYPERNLPRAAPPQRHGRKDKGRIVAPVRGYRESKPLASGQHFSLIRA